ncbi:hypothetical protein MRX96_021593 [Rhipicephalus microplus]
MSAVISQTCRRGVPDASAGLRVVLVSFIALSPCAASLLALPRVKEARALGRRDEFHPPRNKWAQLEPAPRGGRGGAESYRHWSSCRAVYLRHGCRPHFVPPAARDADSRGTA